LKVNWLERGWEAGQEGRSSESEDQQRFCALRLKIFLLFINCERYEA